MALLELDELTRRFGGLVAVDHVTMRVEEGEVRAIIGPNGAGKSTLFNLITGVFKPTEGSGHFAGEPLTGLSVPRICQRGTLMPMAMKSSRMSSASSSSSVGGWKVPARRSRGKMGSASTTTTATSRNIKLAARASPAGPAPTTITGSRVMDRTLAGGEHLSIAAPGGARTPP